MDTAAELIRLAVERTPAADSVDRHRRLLALAGLLRPEAWLFAAAYWVWLRAPVRLLPLAAATTGVEGLEAIIPIAPNTSYYHYYRSNGLIRHPGGWLGEDIDFLYDFIASEIDAYVEYSGTAHAAILRQPGERLPPADRRIDRDPQGVLDLLLADELLEPLRPERQLHSAFLAEHFRRGNLGSHGQFKTGAEGASMSVRSPRITSWATAAQMPRGTVRTFAGTTG